MRMQAGWATSNGHGKGKAAVAATRLKSILKLESLDLCHLLLLPVSASYSTSVYT